MQLKNIYIISYIDKGREDRYKYHKKQLEYLNTIIPDDITINILAMGEGDRPLLGGAKYTTTTARYKQHDARNFFLSQFYESNDDLAIFLDDDCLPKTQNEINFIELIKRIQELTNFDVLTTNFMFSPPKDHIVIRLTKQLAGGFFVLKNLKKHYNEQEYFNTNFDILEDREFGTRLLCKKYAVYMTSGISVLGGLMNNSTIYENQDDRSSKNNVYAKHIDDSYSKIVGYPIHHVKKYSNALAKEKGYVNYKIPYGELFNG